MAVRDSRGAAVFQSRQRVKGRGFSVVGDMVMESNNTCDEGERGEGRFQNNTDM